MIDLDEHIKEEHPETSLKEMIPDRFPFKCSECGKGFASLHTLKIHNEEHLIRVATIKCRVESCEKLFKTAFKEKRHYDMSHKKSKPTESAPRESRPNKIFNKYESHFKCPICPSSVHNIRILKKHIETQHPETPYEEVKDQIDTKPFVCKVCGMKFGRIDNYSDHEKRHTLTERTVKCKDENCNLMYFTHFSMMTHYNANHGSYAKKRTYEIVEHDGTISRKVLDKLPDTVTRDEKTGEIMDLNIFVTKP